MKELIRQEKNNYIFWKTDSDYVLLFLVNKKRKKEKEYKLSEAEKERYFNEGLSFVKSLIEQKGG